MPPMKQQKWMPKQQWEDLVTGIDCPLCTAIESETPINIFGTTIIDLKTGRLRINSNQYVPGYCVFISNKHVTEAHHLDKKARQDFFEDLMNCCTAIEKIFKPIKMNITLLGNSIPHLHAHIIPRYYNDSAPDNPIDPTREIINISPKKQAEVAQKIREHL
jgi:diadenosine tetraphosphate (Ap4A) HIT family hydrolase